MKRQYTEKIVKLEQTGAIKLLLFLNERGECKTWDITKNGVSQPTFYRVMPVLKELGLVEEVVDPPRRIFRLTEKGKKVLEKLMEVEAILSS